jgi:hypothetical protein
MLPQTSRSISALESLAFGRLRDALADNELIYFMGGNRRFEPFVALFDVSDLHDGSTSQMKDGSIYLNTLPAMVRLHEQHRTSHVLITGLNENWGAFSTLVPNRTVDWGVWQDHMVDDGCTPEMVRRYLDDPAVKAVATPHHTAFWHPTIVSIPVGIKVKSMRRFLKQRFATAHFASADREKTQDLLINNSGWRHREAINRRVIENFDGRITNTFGMAAIEFFEAVTRSRFVLCPSGLGWDTSRIWETLMLGAIPIIEYSEGWHTVLDDLPVLFVTNFEEVTPALLASAYPDILSQCERFDYGKLTKRWWASRIRNLLDAPGSS